MKASSRNLRKRTCTQRALELQVAIPVHVKVASSESVPTNETVIDTNVHSQEHRSKMMQDAEVQQVPEEGKNHTSEEKAMKDNAKEKRQ